MNTTDNKTYDWQDGDGNPIGIADQLAFVTAQRDAAVAALRDLADNLDVEAVARARAIIAAVESEGQ